MADKLPGKFMGASKKILEENPDVKEKLAEVMGQVADSLVRKKYVEPSKKSEKSGADSEKHSS